MMRHFHQDFVQFSGLLVPVTNHSKFQHSNYWKEQEILCSDQLLAVLTRKTSLTSITFWYYNILGQQLPKKNF